MAAPIIITRDLRKTYRMGDTTVHALNGVDLSIEAGEFVAVIGSSGSGKSTLMNMMGGLDSPDGGQVMIGGQDIATMNGKELAKFRNEHLGFVFQQFQLMPRQSARQNVMLPLSYRRPKVKDASERAKAALERVGLGDKLSNKPAQLSGGQQQRVAIARALVGQPTLLLADEPTGALDSKTSDEVMALLMDLAKKGLTIVLITHDHAVAAFAERVITMRDGKIVADERNTARAA